MALVQYLIVNKGLGMTPGKLAAQVAHGSVRSALDSPEKTAVWLGEGETKIVLEARDTEHLHAAREYIESKGIRTFLVIDEGRTEVPPLSETVLASELVEKTDPNVRFAFDTFKTYRESPPEAPPAGTYELQAAPRGRPSTYRWLRFTR